MSKKETVSLIDTFSEFKDLKSIDRSTLISVMEESFRNVISKTYGTDENFDVIINPDKGDFEIYRNRTVVADDELTNENMEISLSEAHKIDGDYEVGEEVTDTVDFFSFGRRAILTLRQTLASKILELQKDSLFVKYSEKVGEIVETDCRCTGHEKCRVVGRPAEEWGERVRAATGHTGFIVMGFSLQEQRKAGPGPTVYPPWDRTSFR